MRYVMLLICVCSALITIFMLIYLPTIPNSDFSPILFAALNAFNSAVAGLITYWYWED